MVSLVRGLALSASLLFVCTETPLRAEGPSTSRVTEHVVNGFRVLLMDTQAGSQVAMSYSVPLGHMYDPVRVSGRAHLFEHMMLKGNSKYPGYHTLNEKVVKMGGSKNAYTSSSITNYHVVVPEGQADAAIDVLAASLTGLEWNLETFQSERRVVINEIVKEYLPRASLANYSMAHRHLLPEGHPQKRVFFGDLESLSQMTQDDLKELYFENYNPENVLVIVAGNFSGGQITREQILSSLQQSLSSNQEQRQKLEWKERAGDLATIPQPPVAPAVPGSVLYVGGVEPGPSMVFQFDLPAVATVKTFLVLELLKAYLALPNENSLNSILVHGAPALAVDIGLSSTPLSNRQLIEFAVDLTAEGLEKRELVMELFYRAIRTVAVNGISTEIRAAIESRLIAQHGRTSQRAQALASQMQQVARLNDPDLTHLRWQDAFAKITNEDIKAFARSAFNPASALVSVYSRTIESPIVDKDFGRPYRIESEIPWLNRMYRIWAGLEPASELTPKSMREPDLRSLPDGNARQTNSLPNRRDRVVLESHPNSTDAVIAVQLAGRVPTRIERLAMSLRALSYGAHFRDEFFVFNSRGTASSVGFDGFAVSISAEGSSQETLQALRWHIHRWSQFEPSREIFESTRERVLLGLEDSRFNQFSAALAIDTARQLIYNKPDHQESLNLVRSISYEEMLKASSNWMRRADRSLVLIGDYHQEVTDLLGSELDKIAPARLSVGQRSRWHGRGPALRHHLTTWEESPPGREAMNFGVTRTFSGPYPENMSDVAALYVLSNVLGREVLNLNRSQRNLGYVHSGSLSQPSRGSRYYFHFYGGTDESEERLALTIDGWDQVLNRVRNRTITQDGFAADIRATVSQLTVTPPRLTDRANRYLSSLDIWGRTGARSELIEAIKNLSADQIYAVADQYLGEDRPHLQTIVSRYPPQSCESILKPMAEVRRRLK